MVVFLAGIVISLLGACSPPGLDALLLEGHELHPALVTPQLDDHPIRHVPREVLGGNPHHSADPDFVAVIARSGTQGRRDAEGIHSALYALHVEEKELGFYGLEAETAADADRWEADLREIWAVNVSRDRARVHRGGRVLVVVWTDGVSPECWNAVNEGVAERLGSP
jgi:hypothetical protein